MENKSAPKPTLDEYEPLAHKGLFLGVAVHNRGQYFCYRGGAMLPLMSKLNTPEMFAELKGALEEISDAGVPEGVRHALYRCLIRCKGRDSERGLEMTITLDDLVALYRKQRGRCALTGMLFVLPPHREDLDRRGPWSPSVDRINNRKGYTLDNVQLATVIANSAKADFPVKEFRKMCAHTAANFNLLGPRE